LVIIAVVVDATASTTITMIATIASLPRITAPATAIAAAIAIVIMREQVAQQPIPPIDEGFQAGITWTVATTISARTINITRLKIPRNSQLLFPFREPLAQMSFHVEQKMHCWKRRNETRLVT
jgi:hypothetical protein